MTEVAFPTAVTEGALSINHVWLRQKRVVLIMMHLQPQQNWMVQTLVLCSQLRQQSQQKPGGNGSAMWIAINWFIYLLSTKSIKCSHCEIIVIFLNTCANCKKLMTNDVVINHLSVLISLHHTVYKSIPPNLNCGADTCCIGNFVSKKSPFIGDGKMESHTYAMRNLLF